MKTSIHDLEGVSYAFMPLSRQIVFSGFTEPLTLSNIRGIINTDTNTLIYRIDKPGMGGSLSGDTLTLEYDTTAMGAGDDLSIFFDIKKPYLPTKIVNEKGENITKQLEDLADSLLDISQRIAFLPATRGTLNSIRSEIINTVPVTVSSGTVTTVGNIGAIGGVNTINVIGTMQNNLFANAITSNLSFS